MPRQHNRKLIRRNALAVCALFVFGGQIASAHSGLAEKIAVLSAQLAASPERPDLLLRRAELYREARQWTEALRDADRAERIDPTLATPDLVRGHVNLDRRDWPAAVDAASRFLTRYPRHTDALIVRARASARLGRTRTAVEDFSQALVDRPLPDIYIERARLLAGAGPDDPTQALRSLDEGVDRLGPIVTLMLEAIDLELRLNRYDAALAGVDRVAAQVTRKESWLARRGSILERAGRPGEARAAYQNALDAALRQPERIQQTRASMTLVAELRADIERLEKHVTVIADLSKRSR